LQRVEVSCKALRNKLKIHLEAVHQPDQVEEFGPLFHQGTEVESEEFERSNPPLLPRFAPAIPC